MEKVSHKPVIAIAGNPNSGKTALFNAITGARQHVGNWPGVTVEKKVGTIIKDNVPLSIVDLPGAYSFSSHALDETIARDFILWEHPDAVINVVDATNLERNLYLTLQMLEMGAPLVIALNMFDEAESLGLHIDPDKLSKSLGVKVIPTVAVQKKGVAPLISSVLTLVNSNTPATKALEIEYDPAIEKEISALEELLSKLVKERVNSSLRWLAIKLLENDPSIQQKLTAEVITHLHEPVQQAQTRIYEKSGSEAVDLISEKRYQLAASIAKDVTGTPQDLEHPSYRIDRVALHPWLAYPIFFGIIWLMFQATFTLSAPIADWLEGCMDTLGQWAFSGLSAINAPGILINFIVDGVIAGLGALFTFAPPIFFLFLIISLLEDVGYMARAAVLSDRLMRAVGLHGKAFIPMILGFGCNVTGILATRSLDNPKDRLVSILVNPLISCSARLPVYVLFATAFFPRRQGLVVFSLYALGIVLAAGMAKLLSFFIKSDGSSTFVIELPPYRLPRMSGVLIQTWERGKQFLQKAGTVIFLSVVIVWVLSNLPPQVTPGGPDSAIGRIGGIIAPILRPAGFGTWQAATALLFGAIAKELIVGTLGVLYGASGTGLVGAIQANWTPLSAYAFLVMSLVYVPCVATISAIRQETGSRFWTAFAVIYTLVLGWLLAVLVYQIGGLFGFA